MNKPFVSIIIPCRNEEKFISRCLDSILSQDYPKEILEVLVVDGASEDKSKDILKGYESKYSFIKLLENRKKYTPFGLNTGIKNAKGEIIIRMDAHAGYEKDYVSKCVKYLKEYNTDNVGGIIKTLPAKDTLIAKAIALVLSHRFGTASSFRLGSNEPKFVDTVFGGCYKKEVFERIGLFNENLIRSQDLEFNLRLKRSGGKILLTPAIISYYYPRSTLREFWRHNFEDGVWALYPLKFVKLPLSLRHYLPFIFVSVLLTAAILGIFFSISFSLFLIIFGLYLLLSLFFSAEIALKEKDVRYLFLMPLSFFSRHIGYGLGSIFGLIKLFSNPNKS